MTPRNFVNARVKKKPPPRIANFAFFPSFFRPQLLILPRAAPPCQEYFRRVYRVSSEGHPRALDFYYRNKYLNIGRIFKYADFFVSFLTEKMEGSFLNRSIAKKKEEVWFTNDVLCIDESHVLGHIWFAMPILKRQ